VGGGGGGYVVLQLELQLGLGPAEGGDPLALDEDVVIEASQEVDGRPVGSFYRR